jgi:hypothetical protein
VYHKLVAKTTAAITMTVIVMAFMDVRPLLAAKIFYLSLNDSLYTDL